MTVGKFKCTGMSIALSPSGDDKTINVQFNPSKDSGVCGNINLTVPVDTAKQFVVSEDYSLDLNLVQETPIV